MATKVYCADCEEYIMTKGFLQGMSNIAEEKEKNYVEYKGGIIRCKSCASKRRA
jgi:hypothetical protein